MATHHLPLLLLLSLLLLPGGEPAVRSKPSVTYFVPRAPGGPKYRPTEAAETLSVKPYFVNFDLSQLFGGGVKGPALPTQQASSGQKISNRPQRPQNGGGVGGLLPALFPPIGGGGQRPVNNNPGGERPINNRPPRPPPPDYVPPAHPQKPDKEIPPLVTLDLCYYLGDDVLDSHIPYFPWYEPNEEAFKTYVNLLTLHANKILSEIFKCENCRLYTVVMHCFSCGGVAVADIFYCFAAAWCWR